MTAGHILRALAIYFDWGQNRLMPEWSMGGRAWDKRGASRADLIVLSKSRYLTEVEIKVTLADWNADRQKDKWSSTRGREKVARFFYAIPPSLAERVPEWIPAGTGVLVVYPGGQVQELRTAKRIKTEPVSEATIQKMYEACYFRYWRDRLKNLPVATIGEIRTSE